MKITEVYAFRPINITLENESDVKKIKAICKHYLNIDDDMSIKQFASKIFENLRSKNA